METGNHCTAGCSECDRPNEGLVRLIDALMTMGVDFEIHQHAA